MASILATATNLQLYHGSAVDLALAITDAAGVAFDLTGKTLVWTLKRAITDPLPLLAKSSADVAQIEIVLANGGTAIIHLTTADLSLAPRKYTYDLWVVAAGPPVVRTIVIPPSVLEILAPVTRF